MGVPVEGRFKKFDAQLAFDPPSPKPPNSLSPWTLPVPPWVPLNPMPNCPRRPGSIHPSFRRPLSNPAPSGARWRQVRGYRQAHHQGHRARCDRAGRSQPKAVPPLWPVASSPSNAWPSRSVRANGPILAWWPMMCRSVQAGANGRRQVLIRTLSHVLQPRVLIRRLSCVHPFWPWP